MKNITIVVGGLTGLALGIDLRRRGVPVVFIEAGGYPRHRVCGEFNSGQGQEVFTRLGLGELLWQAGARPAMTAAFFPATGRELNVRLPRAAWCLSRFVLDDLLAREFRRLGGNLREHERWQGQETVEGLVRATGRRAGPGVAGWRAFAPKAHARNVEMDVGLEMHLVPSGYVGLCRLAGDVVNVCGLFRSRTTEPDLAENWPEWLRGPAGSTLRARLDRGVFAGGSFCSTAGISLRPGRAFAQTGCFIGDALTMIPPVAGNGMSMAFESADLATEPLTAYSRGKRPGPSLDDRWPRHATQPSQGVFAGPDGCNSRCHAPPAKRRCGPWPLTLDRSGAPCSPGHAEPRQPVKVAHRGDPIGGGEPPHGLWPAPRLREPSCTLRSPSHVSPPRLSSSAFKSTDLDILDAESRKHPMPGHNPDPATSAP